MAAPQAEAMDPQTAVQALTVVTAIPAVLYALWGDYFGRYMKELAARDPAFSPEPEIFRARLANLCGVLFQVMLFLGSVEVRHAYPFYTYALFLGALVAQFVTQNGAERAVRAAVEFTGRPAPASAGNFPIRILIWTLIGALTYLVVMFGTVTALAAIGHALGATPPVLTLLVALGAVLGIVGGIGLSFAVAPQQVRRMFPTAPLADPALAESFDRAFARAGLRSPSFLVIEMDGPEHANAMITGFRSAPSFLRPALFVSRSLVHGLTGAELHAVVCHEVAHLALSHLRKRFTLSAMLVLGANALAAVLIPLVFFLTPAAPLKELAGPLGLCAAVGAFFYAFRRLGRQSRLQEIEADVHAVAALGAGAEDLASALRKIDRLQAGARTMVGAGLPGTELRIRMLREQLAKRGGGRAAVESRGEAPGSDDRAA